MAFFTRFLFLFTAFSLFMPLLSVDVSYDGRSLKIDGKPKIVLSGSIHYPRSTPEMWQPLIQKAKEGGIDAIETYVFWNAHEPLRRQYDFSGNLDLVRFIKTIQSEGLYAVLRIGPYTCAEWNYGGLPVWLHNIPGIQLRTENPLYMSEMKTFTTLIVDMMKRENLFASQGGPIIISQIENEYGNIMGPYGEAGKEYVNWCAKLAESFNIGVPWIMCQQSDAPQPMINTCNGWYCDQFKPNSPNSPKIWTENWTGWYKGWGLKDPHRTAEDLAFSVARFFQYRGTFMNYYMYHGGTNFGRTAGGPYITTSYDYDAPLDEYGNLNQPKWGHLRQLHSILKSMEDVLTQGSMRDINYETLVSSEDTTINFQNTMYTIPAWSVTILPDCSTEVYNTARVNTQTSIMVKKDNQADDAEEPFVLKWKWRPEHHFERIKKKGFVDGSVMTIEQLLDQKTVTNDTSDYLWYYSSFDLKKSNPIWGKETTLQVHTSGHAIHAYVNGKLVGLNHISLCSATVGLAVSMIFVNYGANFDMVPVGISSGPVRLIAKQRLNDARKFGRKKYILEDISMELDHSKWTYKVGLHGEEELKLQDPYFSQHQKWSQGPVPTNRMFVWYKTTFKAPIGSDPVVVDLMGLGKGHAWVNGHSVGRYWPSYLAGEDGYHVPRSFLRDDENTLILFEEAGGNPFNVKFQTVTVGKACADAYEGNSLELSCQGGRAISEIKFASFGLPEGACGSFRTGSCESSTALSIIQKECLGKERCSLDVSEKSLGPTGCKATNRLAVEVIC
ncbi:beta-galactosidase 15 [Quercus suber]|uniref:Beta-galactosidase n=1 Tax=Quercus suber TaxID=58331 RepID=A0AAW0KLC2_QUESU